MDYRVRNGNNKENLLLPGEFSMRYRKRIIVERDGEILKNQTLRAYEKQAESFIKLWGARRYRIPPLLRKFISEIPKGSRILDLGCGPGQDMRYLSKKGYTVVGLDGVWSFLSWARKKSKENLLIQGCLRHLPILPHRFEGIWAAASLIHLKKSEVKKILEGLHRAVLVGTRLGVTFAYGSRCGIVSHGWVPGRYFSRWRKPELGRMLQSTGWCIEAIETVSNRERKGRWINVIAQKSA